MPCLTRYATGDSVKMRLYKSERLSYDKVCQLIMDLIKEDIWAWFFCLQDCSVELGLTIVQSDRDVNKMYDAAELHGVIDVYVAHFSQLFLVDYYFKNMCVDENDLESTLLLKTHEKKKEKLKNVSYEELVEWEKEERNSPLILRSPPVAFTYELVEWKGFKGKDLLDDFDKADNDEVANDLVPVENKNVCGSSSTN